MKMFSSLASICVGIIVLPFMYQVHTVIFALDLVWQKTGYLVV
ncbi:MAG: hypothetical protein JWR61_2184 [Ferruginibacter sp.]|nr:hypothetical protein [Ferruginibacter sp.]